MDDTQTPADLARDLGIDQRTIRKWLREEYGAVAVDRGARGIRQGSGAARTLTARRPGHSGRGGLPRPNPPHKTYTYRQRVNSYSAEVEQVAIPYAAPDVLSATTFPFTLIWQRTSP